MDPDTNVISLGLFGRLSVLMINLHTCAVFFHIQPSSNILTPPRPQPRQALLPTKRVIQHTLTWPYSPIASFKRAPGSEYFNLILTIWYFHTVYSSQTLITLFNVVDGLVFAVRPQEVNPMNLTVSCMMVFPANYKHGYRDRESIQP